MTIRAVTIGLLIAMLIALFGEYNDVVLALPSFASDQMPIIVYGLLAIGLLAINPVLRFAGGFQLRGKEWALIFSLAMVACIIPGPGLMYQFTGAVVYPAIFQAQDPGYAANADHPDLLSYVPPHMLLDAKFTQPPVENFIRGMSSTGHRVSWGEVPWQAWARPMSFWVPLVLLGFIGSVALALVLHRQWAHREHLRYPIAEVASELIGQDPEQSHVNPLFKNRLFWLGFAVVFCILGINGLNKYHPNVPFVNNEVNLSELDQYLPAMEKMAKGNHLLHPRLWFAAAGLAFLVSSDVSFSIGISHLCYVILFAVLYAWGVEMKEDYFSGGIHSFELFGAYLAGAIVLLYAGRNYYWAVLRKAFFLAVKDDVDRTAAWSCRVLILCVVGMVVLLHAMLGLDWMMSILLILVVSLTFLIATRINVETGLLFVQPTWQAVAIVLGFFGMEALGPQTLVIAGMLCMVLSDDPRVSLLPLIANSLWVADKQKLSLPKVGTWMGITLIAGVALAVPIVIYTNYDKGEVKSVGGWTKDSEKMVFDMLKRGVDKLSAENGLEAAGKATSWGGLERLTQARPAPLFLWALGGGLAFVLLTYAARLRWTWWPIHPVMFMVWGTFITAHYAPSFLLGWLMKVAVTRFGGGSGYRKARPFFIGLIAGEMVIGVVWIAVGLLYYLYVGNKGPYVQVHP